ncbi:MBL fold metallo-hydrolase [Helicobacter sp. MIT 14-3879]|uniref:MBL fold metallo-hydrolase n=1 Tax=Helicobacter sp. MIT 14-3879 TaxID=2040649 RepID=UPI000E1E4CA6|nr:MBL fold metallo-hydrolase [Helicobacter sp. MIT 14-3879]RDU63187.1 hypothetical protein CQA44_05995 [Helicobacter sp. MIT 14-3879]
MRILLLFLTIFIFSFAKETYYIKIGDSDVYIISLKQNLIKKTILIPNTQHDKKLINETYKDKEQFNQHNIMLIKNHSFIALVDTGYPDTINILKNSLKELNINTDDITHIIITHGHLDHIGGLGNNGNRTFPNATMLIDEKEYNYWLNSDNTNATILQLYDTNKIFFDHKNKLLPSDSLDIRAIKAYGHTPGHNIISFNENKEEKLIFWADLLHAFDVQVNNPNISVIYDIDKDQATKTRTKFLKIFKNNKTLVVGTHTPFVTPIILK